MGNKAPTPDAGAAAENTANDEPRDTWIQTTRKQVRVPGPGKGMVIVSGKANFPITASQAAALVAAGDATVIPAPTPTA